MLLNINQASLLCNCHRQTLYDKLKKTPKPLYFVELKDGWAIDSEHDQWKKYTEKMSRRNKKTGAVQVDQKQEIQTFVIDQNIGKEKPATHSEHSKLIEESSIAQLKKPIIENQIKSYRAEREKIELEKKAGNLMETEFAKFVYLGFLNKCSTDFLYLTRKIKPRLIACIEDRDIDGAIRLINKEISLILATIKKAQIEDLKKWELER